MDIQKRCFQRSSHAASMYNNVYHRDVSDSNLFWMTRLANCGEIHLPPSARTWLFATETCFGFKHLKGREDERGISIIAHFLEDSPPYEALLPRDSIRSTGNVIKSNWARLNEEKDEPWCQVSLDSAGYGQWPEVCKSIKYVLTPLNQTWQLEIHSKWWFQ